MSYDPRLRNMSSSVFDLNQANTMRHPGLINQQQQWMPNNMQQVSEKEWDFLKQFIHNKNPFFQAQSMAQLNHIPGHAYPQHGGWPEGSLNGSNMSLNMPYYPQQSQQQWMNQWPGMYPYPVGMVPMVPAGKRTVLIPF